MILSEDFLTRLRSAMERHRRPSFPALSPALRQRRLRAQRPALEPLTEFILELLEQNGGPLVFVLDGSLPMTFAGDSPPVPSAKFGFAQRLAAAVGCAALHLSLPVHLVPVGAVSGRRGPLLRNATQIPSWLESIEDCRAGGTRHFRYALRNQILRGGPDAFIVVLSDFRNGAWESALSALVAGESRVALVQIVDDLDHWEVETPPALRVPFAVGQPETSDEIPEPVLPSAGEIHQYLRTMAIDHRMELLGIHVAMPIEDAVLKAAEVRR